MVLKGMHCFISGHVQGVFYRRFVATNAQMLELKGWVKNLPDGRVEAKFFGTKEVIDTLILKLWTGPPRAVITDVYAQEVPFETCENFSVR